MLDTNKIKSEVEGLSIDTRKWLSKRDFINLNKDEFVESMKTKYEYLYTNSTTLFERCMKGELNMTHLEYMLNKIEKVNAGADYHSTSVEVGQRLVDVYVKPMLDKKE
jgi:hypothetical protein